jgi:hypothetical protein
MGIRTIPHDYTIHSTTWNASQFNTLSFRERAQYFQRGTRQLGSMAGKTLVDASRLDPEHDLDPRRVGAHRPSLTCPAGKVRVKPEKAAYIVHHYPGTLPQYTFRLDPRENVRSLDRYYELNFTRNNLTNSAFLHETNDLPDTWVEDFVNKVGHDLAQELLEDIGTVEELSFDSGTSSRFQYHMDPDDEDGFGACLLTMEDNHYLIEWLAYHYHFLPLRRLIIAVDPASRTSPQSILDRYENLIDITLLNDTVLFQDLDVVENKVYLHRLRQSALVTHCLKQMKDENRTWVALVDTDEYIVAHGDADDTYRVRDPKPTLYQMLQSTENANPRIPANTSCVSLRRPQMSIQTTSILQNYTIHDNTWNASQFLTLLYRQRAQYFDRGGRKGSQSGKTIVHAGRISYDDLELRTTGPHRPSLNCPRGNNRVPPQKATYLVHHYPGTLQQYTFRHGSDPRENVRTLDRYYELNFTRDETNDLPYTWVEDFANKVGQGLAEQLLEGIGTVEDLKADNKLSYNTTWNEFTLGKTNGTKNSQR